MQGLTAETAPDFRSHPPGKGAGGLPVGGARGSGLCSGSGLWSRDLARGMGPVWAHWVPVAGQ